MQSPGMQILLYVTEYGIVKIYVSEKKTCPK